jgi:DNA-binding NarL/FixJ family response regulator
MLDAEDGYFARTSEGLRQIIKHIPLANRHLAILLDDIASLAAMLDQPARAARLFGACQHATEMIGLDKYWVDPVRIEVALASAREALGPAGFEAELERGKRLTHAELGVEIEALLQDAWLAGDAGRGPSGPKPVAQGLTSREQEVLHLLTERYTNPEIAERLNVGTRTIQTHVSHILQKLGVNNRREAARAARRLGLS